MTDKHHTHVRTKVQYARKFTAQCSMDADAVERMMPVLKEVLLHSAEDPGFKEMKFYRDESTGVVFSISLYDTQAHRDAAFDRDSDSEYRRQKLAEIGCTALSAEKLTIIASLDADHE